MDALVDREPTFHDAYQLWKALIKGYEHVVQEGKRLGQQEAEDVTERRRPLRDHSAASLERKLERTEPVSRQDGMCLADMASHWPRRGFLLR